MDMFCATGVGRARKVAVSNGVYTLVVANCAVLRPPEGGRSLRSVAPPLPAKPAASWGAQLITELECYDKSAVKKHPQMR